MLLILLVVFVTITSVVPQPNDNNNNNAIGELQRVLSETNTETNVAFAHSINTDIVKRSTNVEKPDLNKCCKLGEYFEYSNLSCNKAHHLFNPTIYKNIISGQVKKIKDFEVISNFNVISNFILVHGVTTDVCNETDSIVLLKKENEYQILQVSIH